MKTARIKLPMMTRRQILIGGAAALAGGTLVSGSSMAQPAPVGRDVSGSEPGAPDRDYTPVVVPNGWTLPFRVIDGVKTFHLVAEEVEHELTPGLVAHCWGYNGSVHGPVIEAVEGDRVRIFVTNRLDAPTSVHWHGLILPSGMDGVSGISQRAILKGETYMYEFTLKQHGTFMYHSHHDEMTQIALGMTGLFVIHPRGVPPEERPDRDFALMLHEWAIEVGTSRPDPNEMTDFNVLTINGRAFPGTEPLVARQGQRVRFRFANLGPMDHHPMHLHGYTFRLTETDGGPIPEPAQWPLTTVLVPVGTTRTVELVADNPGDWPLHCHMTHHMMNQMGHGIPNTVGIDTKGLDEKLRALLPSYMTMGQEGMGEMGEHVESGHMLVPPNSVPMVGAMAPKGYITMGGMFTLFKVREALDGYGDPGWYEDPPGTLAEKAGADALRENGISATDYPKAPRRSRA